MNKVFDTRWKIWNEIKRRLAYPAARVLFAVNQIPWGQEWCLYGLPILQKHGQSNMRFGDGLQLRSNIHANPLGANHPVILCTWQAGAVLEIGDNFAMTGGSIVAARQITIGNRVTVGANCTISDTDFHPVPPEQRALEPQAGSSAPIRIEDDVFIGMNCLILKGVTIGKGTTIGAGSVVSGDIPPGVVAAGNPARVIRRD